MDCERHKDGSVDIRHRKFGLPGWMVTNMERLNHATDFEQYGSSPPETESFLTEAMEYSTQYIATDHTEFHETRRVPTAPFRHPEDLVRTAVERNHRPPPLTNPRLDHDLVSSPDSTPCVTPEPSPVIRRKVSIPHPGDTVLTNPGRWFYFGKLKKFVPDSAPIASTNKSCDSTDRPSAGGVKLVISNFDLNAVSPNSW